MQALEAAGNFYAYEKRFDEIWTELGRLVLQKSIGEVPVDRHKKRLLPLRQNRNSGQASL
ncbi:MAG: hypothetical protein ICV51_04030 [Flavisolibacter sp.]|nr:hypothetical protein [Flavisolibacter sp.]